MATLTTGEGKRQLHDLETQVEESVNTLGETMKRIRENHLYRFDGFETWESYCSQRWGWKKAHCNRQIAASEYRKSLPDPKAAPNGSQAWNERCVRELTRMPDKKEAVRVATKIVKAVDEDPTVKITAGTVRRFVDADLGIDRAAKAKETKAQREYDSKIDLIEYMRQNTGSFKGIASVLEGVPAESWELLAEEHPNAAKRFVEACQLVISNVG